MDLSFFSRIIPYLRTHRPYVAAAGAAAAVGTIVSLVRRARAASVGEALVEKIKSVLGTPYIWGSRSPEKGLDCSGAVVWALRELGFEPKNWNSTAADLHKQSETVIFPQPGDLCFYGSLLGGVDHVMTYLGDGKCIGASGGGPSTRTVAEARAKNAAVKILPVNYRTDFRGYGRLPVQAVTEAQVGLHLLGFE